MADERHILPTEPPPPPPPGAAKRRVRAVLLGAAVLCAGIAVLVAYVLRWIP